MYSMIFLYNTSHICLIHGKRARLNFLLVTIKASYVLSKQQLHWADLVHNLAGSIFVLAFSLLMNSQVLSCNPVPDAQRPLTIAAGIQVPTAYMQAMNRTAQLHLAIYWYFVTGKLVLYDVTFQRYIDQEWCKLFSRPISIDLSSYLTQWFWRFPTTQAVLSLTSSSGYRFDWKRYLSKCHLIHLEVNTSNKSCPPPNIFKATVSIFMKFSLLNFVACRITK